MALIKRLQEQLFLSINKGGFVFLIAASIAVGQLGVSLYLPAIPGIGNDLNASSSLMAMTLTVYFAGFAFFNLFSGPFSDALGRRFMILRGLEVYGLGTLLCALATDITMLLAGRTLQAFGAGVAPVVGKAMIQDSSSDNRTVVLMGWLGAAISITPAVAPFIGGIITEHLKWQWTFWSLLIFNALVWLLNFSLLSETISHPPSRRILLVSVFKTYREFLGNRVYVGYLLTLGACFGGLGAYYTASPFIFIRDFQLSPSLYGLITLIIATGFIIGNLSAGRLTRSRCSHRLIYIGGILVFMGALAIFCIPRGFVTAASILVMTFIFSVGFGIIFPIVTKEALGCYVDRAGAAAALLGFFQLGVSALSSLAVGFLQSQGMSSYNALAIIMFLCAILAVASIYIIHRRR
jgi:DHA1 family bicyclomycin/chloramphenicol resistance-like MFS transporter